ncbi:MAG: adenylosuccinate lyase [Armatimonadota bacterium]|nr:adenylosuccinate lyase [Armatimonadota bacterium]
MIDRYTLPPMKAIWSAENKCQRWLDVEIAVCEGLAQVGEIPKDAVDLIRKNAHISVDRMLEIEQETRHDFIAFIKTITEGMGEEARYVHYGITSYDAEDTALSLLLRDSADLILTAAAKLLEAIKKRAQEHKYTVMIGRTHGIHAEPITLGLKFAVWYDEVRRNIQRVQEAREVISFGKISGAVGTFANVSPEVEEYVFNHFGLKPAPVSTQILQRDRHAQFLAALAIFACSLEKFAVEVRNLQRTEIREVEEFFAAGQRGSSAMPHKRNPSVSEQISGLARVVRSNLVAGMENVALWHERDLTNSSVERIILPDSCILVHYMLDTFAGIVEKLLVYPENMRANLDKMRGLVYSQQVMLELVRKGMSREEAYKIVQRNAMKTWEGASFQSALEADPEVTSHLTSAEIEQCFADAFHTSHVDTIFNRVGL